MRDLFIVTLEIHQNMLIKVVMTNISVFEIDHMRFFTRTSLYRAFECFFCLLLLPRFGQLLSVDELENRLLPAQPQTARIVC